MSGGAGHIADSTSRLRQNRNLQQASKNKLKSSLSRVRKDGSVSGGLVSKKYP
jgi:hypothetical protein